MSTQYVLGCDFQFADPTSGVTVLKAGKVIDSGMYNITQMQAAGALLYPKTTATLAASARLASQDSLRGQHGMLLDTGRRIDAVGPFAGTNTAGSGVVLITHALSPYNVQPTDSLIECNVSGGAITLNLPAAPTQGEVHAVSNTVGDASVNNITISGNGKNVEDPNSLTTFSASVAITTHGGEVAWKYDGTQWVIV